MCCSDWLFQDEDLHPFVHDILVVFRDKGFCHLFIFGGQRLNALFVTCLYVYQFPILQNEVKDALTVGIAHMHMDRLMFPREEEERKAEVFIYFGHLVCCYLDLQKYTFFST